MKQKFDAVDLPLSAATSPRLQWAYAFWHSRKGERALPSRADFVPEEIKPLLGRVMIIDVGYDPRDLRYAIFGSEIAQNYGRDMTGRSVRDLSPPEFAALLFRLSEEAITARVPRAHTISHGASHQRSSFERLVLPLASDGVTIDKIVVVCELKRLPGEDPIGAPSGASDD